jgi:hypothetical protein
MWVRLAKIKVNMRNRRAIPKKFGVAAIAHSCAFRCGAR